MNQIWQLMYFQRVSTQYIYLFSLEYFLYGLYCVFWSCLGGLSKGEETGCCPFYVVWVQAAATHTDTDGDLSSVCASTA